MRQWPLALLCVCVVLLCTLQAALAQQRCPGLAAGACGPACQQETCQALQAFFNATHVRSPWHIEDGWELLKSQTCQQLIGGGVVPSYCDWHGLACCTPSALAQQQCTAVNSVVNVTLPVNALNGSIGAELFVDSLVRLHACGLANVALEGNDLSGTFSPRWGELTQLRVLDLGSNWLTGTLPAQLGQLQALRRLELNGNYLYGALPAWLNNMTQLEVLNLGDNGGASDSGMARATLSGPLPAALVRSAQLRELGLDGAALQGGLPDPLCGPNSSVRVISMRNAGLTGRADGVLSCTALSLLDLSHNQLTGPLPASADWSGMQVLQLQSNGFSGDLPAELWQLRYVAVADISNNRVTGTLSRDILVLHYLSAFLASGNRLSGSIPPDVFYSPGLTRLRLDHNQLTGTLPDSFLYAYSLKELSVAYNPGLNGTLPDAIGALPLLTAADFTNTSLSCDAASSANGTCAQPLPCFLSFASYQGPALGGVQCNALVRKSPQAAAAACPSGLRQQLLGIGIDNRPAARTDFRWHLDRSYYQFRTCSCLPDETSEWAQNGTELVCMPGGGSGGATWWRALLVALFSTVAVLLASWVLTRVLVGARYQPRWLRQQDVRRKRASGPPRSGTVSVVVTDIEGYSELMRYSPSLMTRALGLHNAVIRRASWTHGGHVIEQEGDSFTIAFHEPMDAVSFCLQAQQALMLVDWPAGLGTGPENADAAAAAAAAAAGDGAAVDSSSKAEQLGAGSKGSELGAAPSRIEFGGHRGDFGGSREGFGSAADLVALERMLGSGGGSSYKRVRSSLDIPNRLQRVERAGSGGSHGRAGGSEGAMDRTTLRGLDASPFDRSFTSHHRSDDEELVVEQSGQQQQRSNHSLASLGRHPSMSPSGPSRTLTHAPSMGGRISSLFGHLPGPLRGKSKASVGGIGVPRSGSSGTDSQHRFFSLFLRPVGADAEMLFYGLRVRMGVATGVLQEGTALKNSAAVDLAKLVSDAGGGGQVLVEAATFDSIRDRLHELGAVDGRGVNERWLQTGRSLGLLLVVPIGTGLKRCWRFLARGMEGADDDVIDGSPLDKRTEGDEGKPAAGHGAAAHSSREAVVMDMGEYEVPGVDAAAATAAAVPDRWTAAFKSTLGRNPWQRFSVADNPLTRGSTVTQPMQRRSALDAAMKRSSIPDQPFRRRSVVDGSGDGGNAPLRLYSVLPPPLVGRAKVWGNALALKEDTKQVDSAYFDAPGTLYAEVDRAAAAAADADAIAMVTMVAVAVEGARGYMRWRRGGDGRLLASMVQDCLRQCLAAVPAGYLCREQDEGMRYMVAFPNAHSALQWCLATQEAMLYQPWPASLLSYPGFGEFRSKDGRLLFRGPRLKMGVCEGCPRAILPDFLGRAEYSGPSVTQAVRLMQSVAHGGQVVCELELAQRVFRRWRHEDEFGVDSLDDQPGDQANEHHADSFTQRMSWRGRLEGAGSMPHEGQPGEAASAAERASSLSPKAAQGWLSRVWRHDHMQPATTADSTLQIRGTSTATMPRRSSAGDSRTSSEYQPSPTTAMAASAAAAATAASRHVPSPFAAASMQGTTNPPLTAEQALWFSKPGRGRRSVDQGAGSAHEAPRPGRALGSLPAGAQQLAQRSASAESADALSSLPQIATVVSGSPPERALSDEAQRRLALLFGKAVPGSMQRAVSHVPRACVAVEATHLGTFRLHGTEVEAVAISVARLAGRRYHWDPPKANTRILVRDGVADGALCELPDASAALRSEYEAQQRREEEQRRLVAAAVERAEATQQLRQQYGSSMLRRSMSVLGSRNRTNSMSVKLATLEKFAAGGEEQQRPDLEEARDQR